MQALRRLWRDNRGMALAEYGLLAAIVGATIAVASLAVGSAVSSEISTPTPCQASTAGC